MLSSSSAKIRQILLNIILVPYIFISVQTSGSCSFLIYDHADPTSGGDWNVTKLNGINAPQMMSLEDFTTYRQEFIEFTQDRNPLWFHMFWKDFNPDTCYVGVRDSTEVLMIDNNYVTALNWRGMEDPMNCPTTFYSGQAVELYSFSSASSISGITTSTTFSSTSAIQITGHAPAIYRYACPPTESPTKSPTMPTISPSTPPSKSPSKPPTKSPTYELCTGLTEIDWIQLNTAGQSIESSITSNWDDTNLELSVDITLEYITRSSYSFLDSSSNRGVTYVIDTEPFLSNGRLINDPNNCENRVSSSFNNKSWSNDYWSYLDAVNGLNSPLYLEYGPSGIWSLDWNNECSSVKYSNSFLISDLLQCSNKNGAKTFSFIQDENWLNLTGNIYVTLVSPLINQNYMEYDNGEYLANTIITYPVSLSFPKKISLMATDNDRNYINTDLFGLSIFALIYNVTNNKLIIDMISYSTISIYLQNSNLISPIIDYLDIFGTTINKLTITEIKHNYRGYNEECLFETTFRCFQKWMLEIDLNECPSTGIDLTTVVLMNTEPQCRTGYDCSTFENDFGPSGTSTQLTDSLFYIESCNQNLYIQSFNGIIKFYEDAAFSHDVTNDNTFIFAIESRIYIDLSIADNDNIPYSLFNINILNVWICTTSDLNDLSITSQLNGDGGCIADDINISEIYQVFKDGVVFNTNLAGLIHETSDYHSTRFSFIIPAFQRSKFHIHVVVELDLDNDIGRRRRRLIFEDEQNTTNRISHYIHSFSNSNQDSTYKVNPFYIILILGLCNIIFF